MNTPPESIRHVALIGLGWHARRVYYPWLEEAALQDRVRISAVVDLHANSDTVRNYLAQRRVAPGQLLFTESGLPTDALPEDLLRHLNGLRAAGQLDGVIISTEPRAHKRYVMWALQSGIHVLLDKPISAPANAASTAEVAQALWKDFEDIAQALAASRSRLVVQAQRRMHAGYGFIKRYLEDFLQEYGVPISFLDLYHADGMWVMPDEWDREHHAYKNRTGKLLHSGYHFVDLGSWLLESNRLANPASSLLEFQVQTFEPKDFLALLDGRYEKLFGPGGVPAPVPSVGNHGEMDLTLMGRVLTGETVQTLVSLQLLQNSFSRRASPAPPADPYKGAGRVRHERMNLQVGPLLNLQVHSYQSYETRDHRVQAPYGPGHLDHFDVYVFRNADAVGGTPFEKLEFGKTAQPSGHNEQARLALLEAFLQGHPSGSELEDHRRTNLWMSQIYQAIHDRRTGTQEVCRMPWS
ncbi:Gfo/Idh/MocA family oxidoreductase [Stigmatella sp. ncwal1]|uniref:Gfo/Idh/MocA family oxidoreductase n=1 Tax=Stigmatella ashevillensis TaxID=2995309 RepID=A0ABT5CZT4_9BACT|nr:Gfo/Idh/MocA family oxidoreductase [Stigmatella ashevillena]MDC0706934.1 Gfo/Idh/MocA family oxidoreductase [Stigmatella ashevillena]